jgi:hypothetical protein
LDPSVKTGYLVENSLHQLRNRQAFVGTLDRDGIPQDDLHTNIGLHLGLLSSFFG